jgi:hypothetical protein
LCCRFLAEQLHERGQRKLLQLCLGVPNLSLSNVKELVPLLVELVAEIDLTLQQRASTE